MGLDHSIGKRTTLERWTAEAPANIALIKYMGKVVSEENKPSNASLSYSLDHLISRVEIVRSSGDQDELAPLLSEDFETLTLSEKSKTRFLSHFQFLKEQLGIKGHFKVFSANNFPSDCGIASSASSFAALTQAAYQLALDLSDQKAKVEALSPYDLSMLSRRGSGSSCRSLFTPWALWRSDGAEKISFPWVYLHHQVVVLEKEKKEVSSSAAHLRVLTSELFKGRPERAGRRLEKLVMALQVQNWREACELVWADFWDMHALFETSTPSFGYMTSGSLSILEVAREQWKIFGDGPMVTMDAGANVHLLYRPDQKAMALKIENQCSSLGSALTKVISSPSLKGEA